MVASHNCDGLIQFLRAMSFINWLSQEYFSAIHIHEQNCQRKATAFCELYEVPQNEVLRLALCEAG